MKKYKLLQLTFFDHVKDGDEPLVCHVAGWLLKETDDYLLISSWIVDCPDSFDSNLEKFCIMRSAIISQYEIN